MNIQVDQIKQDCQGKWPSIFSALGVEVGQGRHTCCPVCSPGDQKSNRFRFSNETGNGEWYCNQCSPHAGDGIALVMNVLGIDFKTCLEELAKIVGTVEATPYQKERKVSPEYLRKIIKSSTKMSENDVSHNYLKNRGLNTIPQDVWTSLKCFEPETKQNKYAMLSVFRSQEGEALTIHRLYLSQDSEKLKIDSPKKMLPPLKPMAGGAVRLFNPEGKILGIAEGVETAIAVHESMNIPCWAALTANLLESWEPPKGIERVCIYADNDKNFTGQKAAYALANRLFLKNKLIVYVEIPEMEGYDFLDEMNEV